MGSAFPLLTTDQLDLTIDQPDFQQTLQDTLGNLGTDQDGFDAAVYDTITVINAGVALALTLDADINGLSQVANSIDPNSLDAQLASLPASLAEGDAILAAAQQLNAGVQPVGTPPSGGGSGGQASCVTQDFGNVAIGTVPSITINIANRGNANLTITGITVQGNNGPNIFSISNTYQGHVLGPGSSVPLTINCNATNLPSAGQYTSTLTINTNPASAQSCMNLTANVTGTPGSPGSGGGSGGGGGGGGGGGCDVGFDPQGRLGCVD